MGIDSGKPGEANLYPYLRLGFFEILLLLLRRDSFHNTLLREVSQTTVS
jgi:hypothetical protein